MGLSKWLTAPPTAGVHKTGEVCKGVFVAPKTIGRGSAWTITFSHDPQQKYLLVGDGGNCVIWILNRNDGTTVGKFGHRGANAGQFLFLDETRRREVVVYVDSPVHLRQRLPRLRIRHLVCTTPNYPRDQSKRPALESSFGF